MSPYALLSRLLDYPNDELWADLGELERAARALPGGARRPAERFLADVRATTPAELRRAYVEELDFDRRASLFLTFHTHGDRRQRGIELVRLKRRYAAAGLELAEGQLPDYLPAVLEFAALAPGEGAAVLAGQRVPLELVRGRLRETGSRYADLLDAVAALLPALSGREAARLRRLAEHEPPVELVGLDPDAPVPDLEVV